jgi:hypothetical protein
MSWMQFSRYAPGELIRIPAVMTFVMTLAYPMRVVSRKSLIIRTIRMERDSNPRMDKTRPCKSAEFADWLK